MNHRKSRYFLRPDLVVLLLSGPLQCTGFLTIEIKTQFYAQFLWITGPFSHTPAGRSQRSESKALAIWNMQVAEQFTKVRAMMNRSLQLIAFSATQLYKRACSTEDWLQSAVEESLKKSAESILATSVASMG